MHSTVRDWITKILEERKLLVALAVRQRAKFEGWLKFELAYRAALAGASDVEVESGSTTLQDGFVLISHFASAMPPIALN